VRAKGEIPFIVKMGVGSASDHGKLLPREDVEKSINMQHKINNMQQRNFFFFPETLGIILKDGLFKKDSGLIIREIPDSLRHDECHIFSFSALMSIERTEKENHGLCRLLPQEAGLGGYPLIFEIIEWTRQLGLVKSADEFIRKYLVAEYIKAIEEFFFTKGYSFSPHGQNLCFVIRKDGTPQGFAYRDFEGISEGGQSYTATYTWFYRYHCLVKLLNVLTEGEEEYFDYPLGAPVQLGSSTPLKERNLLRMFKDKPLAHLTISKQENENILMDLDNLFLKCLSKYFSVENISELKAGAIPCAEPGEETEIHSARLDEKLWKHRGLKEDALKTLPPLAQFIYSETKFSVETTREGIHFDMGKMPLVPLESLLRETSPCKTKEELDFSVSQFLNRSLEEHLANLEALIQKTSPTRTLSNIEQKSSSHSI
jgi:hypothetical protein